MCSDRITKAQSAFMAHASLGLRQRTRANVGQLFRIVGAGHPTAAGLVPQDTGGAKSAHSGMAFPRSGRSHRGASTNGQHVGRRKVKAKGERERRRRKAKGERRKAKRKPVIVTRQSALHQTLGGEKAGTQTVALFDVLGPPAECRRRRAACGRSVRGYPRGRSGLVPFPDRGSQRIMAATSRSISRAQGQRHRGQTRGREGSSPPISLRTRGPMATRAARIGRAPVHGGTRTSCRTTPSSHSPGSASSDSGPAWCRSTRGSRSAARRN